MVYVELPLRILRPFLGARIIKTGLAVFLSLVAFHWIGSGYATFAGVAAVLAVQPSVSRARQVFGEQLLSNFIGGLVGAILGWLLGPSPMAMAAAVVLVLGLCSAFGLREAASVAVVAVLFIMDRPENEILLYTAARMGAIMGGMLVGYLVNRFIHPPQYTKRLKEDLQAGADGLETFGAHLIGSLSTPEHYRKEQIKGEAAAIAKRLENARYFLDLFHESEPDDPRLLPLEKAKASMFVFVERITDIHKIVLQAGGLQQGPEADTVASAIRAALGYKRTVMQATLHGGRPDPAAGQACHEALRKLEALAGVLVDDPATRTRGLTLHSILTNVRHMSWRMESLSRLLLPPES